MSTFAAHPPVAHPGATLAVSACRIPVSLCRTTFASAVAPLCWSLRVLIGTMGRFAVQLRVLHAFALFGILS